MLSHQRASNKGIRFDVAIRPRHTGTTERPIYGTVAMTAMMAMTRDDHMTCICIQSQLEGLYVFCVLKVNFVYVN
jgi:hypothetical protein